MQNLLGVKTKDIRLPIHKDITLLCEISYSIDLNRIPDRGLLEFESYFNDLSFSSPIALF